MRLRAVVCALTLAVLASGAAAAGLFTARTSPSPFAAGPLRAPRRVGLQAQPVKLSAAAAVLPEHSQRGPRGLESIRFSSKLNAFGLSFALNCIFWGALFLLPMYVASLLDKTRATVSSIGNAWGRLVLRACRINATCIDADKLPPKGTPAMYVANHCSYLDIPLTGLLRRPLKYISKSEVKKLPIIGLKLDLAKDLCVTRGDRRSEARVFVDAVRALKDGLSILAFPEGTTTTTGRLLPFKRGPFKMAVSAGVPIVPLTIMGTYDAWPKGSIGPQRNVPLSIQVHDPISVEGKTEEELCELARAAVESGLTPSSG